MFLLLLVHNKISHQINQSLQPSFFDTSQKIIQIFLVVVEEQLASMWLTFRLDMIGVLMVTSISLLAVLEHHYGGIDPGKEQTIQLCEKFYHYSLYGINLHSRKALSEQNVPLLLRLALLNQLYMILFDNSLKKYDKLIRLINILMIKYLRNIVEKLLHYFEFNLNKKNDKMARIFKFFLL